MSVPYLRPTAATCPRRDQHDPTLPADALGYHQRLVVLTRDHDVTQCPSCGEYRIVRERGGTR